MFRPMPAFLLVVLLAPAAYAAETQCQNRADDDGDGVVDCADADCFSAKECQPGGGEENTDLACSDFVDNDNDTLIDCDDPDCEGRNVKACRGSWQRDEDGPARPAAAAQGTPGKPVDLDAMIGADGDLDGERTNDVCADGMDNDGDGKTDCEDYGCRYDPAVTVCQPNAGSRFSVVVGVQQSHLAKSVAGVVTTQDTTGLDRLQLRALGSIPTVSNSFYMISIRAERAIRTTFALFQIPLGTHGHYVNVNTGSGGLSSALVVSAANQLFLDPAAYVYRATALRPRWEARWWATRCGTARSSRAARARARATWAARSSPRRIATSTGRRAASSRSTWWAASRGSTRRSFTRLCR